MTEGDRPHSGRTLRRSSSAAVVLVLVLAALAYRFDLGDRLGVAAPDPVQDPAAVAPPPGLSLPAPVVAEPVAEPLPRVRLDPDAVRRAVGRLGLDKRLGRRFTLLVGDLRGRPVLDSGPAVVTPASTMKLLTCIAALQSLGPEHRFTTAVRGSGRRIVLVGGGDPLLTLRAGDGYPAQADLVSLAAETARALRAEDRTRVRLGYDDSLFSGPSSSPAWEPDYLPDDVVSPISALWIDEGRLRPGLADRSDNPAGDATALFARLLRKRGVTVVGALTDEPAPKGATELASVHSAELVELVQHVLETSDNEGAEVLARQVALAEGRPGSFAGAGAAVRAVADDLGISLAGAVLEDGSGLSRADRLPAAGLMAVLATAVDPEHPLLSGLVEGLPVAGFSGSLSYRFVTDAGAGLGRVRAKTGTLTGVHGLAGVVTGRDGSLMTFVAVADRVRPVNTLWVRDRLDQVAAALAGCRCAAPS
jgi:D-alanyl-D-alanine carboxypeptidase/D-alanyl-D-alanine-endopeptidase (penicillin-binding protein 4)